MATVGETEVLVTKTGDVETGVLKENVVHVQSIGKETKLSGYLYGDANFYIRCSAQYFRNRRESSLHISISTTCSMSTLWFSSLVVSLLSASY